ncbi:MAG: glycogen synthase [Bacteriodetes bacterium]|nr:glycogen synthase [Bacteroidota bacterium]
MNILSVAAECAPYAKIGGLGDVVSALPKDWEQLGHNCVIVIPKYRDIDVQKYNFQPTNITVVVPMSSWKEYARVWMGTLPGTKNVRVCLLESYDYFDRKGIYGNPDGFSDNDRRFTFLSRACFEVAKALDFTPDILHAHDYHTSLALAFLKSHYRFDPRFARCAGVYTIHNMAFQGQSDPRRVLEFAQLGTQNFRGSWFEHDGVVNLMKTGLMFADKITTVSPNYANEIRWTSFGEGMQDYVEMRSGDFLGVLNGADYTEWNPETDTNIKHHYTPETLNEKALVKQELLQESVPAYDVQEDLPLIGMVSRLTDQKGIILVEQVLERLVKSGRVRFAILGSGDSRYERFFNAMGKKYPTRVLYSNGYNNALSHKIIAASDYIMVPSLFEPCGLTQIFALKYGTVPIVRATGGLADTVEEYNPETGTGNGFLFEKYVSRSLLNAISRAVYYYKSTPHWDTVRLNGMACNYSSRLSAENYINVFTWALQRIGRRT